jgi:hypothetical protein
MLGLSSLADTNPLMDVTGTVPPTNTGAVPAASFTDYLANFFTGPSRYPAGTMIQGVDVSGQVATTDANAQICSNDFEYATTPGCWAYSLASWDQLASADVNTAATITMPPAPPAATQAQIDTCTAAADPGTCAAALVQSLSNDQVSAAQAAINANAQTAPPVSPAPTPFCGTGSDQWISGIDNCVLLGVSAVGILFVFAKLKG